MAGKETVKVAWSDVKAELAKFDRAGLMALVQDLYKASKDNQNFLHARLGLGDVITDYKVIIQRWILPDVYKNQQYSIKNAKKPISDYKKASGTSQGLAELEVFFCEKAIEFSNLVGLDDAAFYDALVLMFEKALQTVMVLPEPEREPFLDRLYDVRYEGRGIGFGITESLNSLWKACGFDD